MRRLALLLLWLLMVAVVAPQAGAATGVPVATGWASHATPSSSDGVSLFAAASPFAYDAPPYVEQADTVMSAVVAMRPHGPEGAAAPAPQKVGHVYDPARDLVAPTSALDDVARVVSGGGGSIDNIATSDALRIQNAADRIGNPITVVGSRAEGTAGAWSDWDYVIPGVNSRTRHSVSSSLPTGASGLGELRNLDIFTGPLSTDLPHVTFYPSPPG